MMLSLQGFTCIWYVDFRVQVVMMVKLADISRHMYLSTYFRTVLLTPLGYCRVQILLAHPVH